MAHVLSNIFWEGVFIYFLLREIEPSIAWALILLGGILGNLINYFYHPLNHISIGFSTCVFATCGISVGIRSVQNPRDIGIYVMTGLGLFAMLGIGAQIVDVGSHFFGLIIGFILGVVFELFELDKISFKNSLIFFCIIFSSCPVMGHGHFFLAKITLSYNLALDFSIYNCKEQKKYSS